ncbi:MFS transporter [Sphingomonas chungangi]|uniref:MFS transporter n=1 Tax=Sphingomonas chungangi TaxID=2683589 RepID=UPI0031B5AC7E
MIRSNLLRCRFLHWRPSFRSGCGCSTLQSTPCVKMSMWHRRNSGEPMPAIDSETPGGSGLVRPIPDALIGLLGCAMLLNYADRGSLSITAPVLKESFGIDNAAMGLLLSSFFWSYAFSQPIAGWITQRFPPRTVLASGVALWSVATIACGFATSFALLFTFRLLLGIGESVIFPVNACIYSRAPEAQRGRANGMMAVGSYIGPFIGTLAGGVILASLGWRAVFWVLGGVSLIWVLPWLAMSRSLLRYCAEPHPDPANYREILGTRGLWGASLGQFCYSYQFYLVLTWLPLYLVKSAHFSIAQMTAIGGTLYISQSVTAGCTGLASDLLVTRGFAPTVVRKSFLVFGLTLTGSCLSLISIAPAQSALLLVLAGVGNGFTGPMVFSIGQTLAGPRAGGRWMGIQNMIGNFSGITAPIVTGIVADRTGSFAGAFILAGIISVVGIISWIFVVGPVCQTRWQSRRVTLGQHKLAV